MSVLIQPRLPYKERAGSRLFGDLCLAWTEYKTLGTYHRQCALLDVQLITGFKHQIRAHLSDGIGCPVLGDFLFAGPLFRKEASLARKMVCIGERKGYRRGPVYLHAYEVRIPREMGKPPLVINAPLPNYFVDMLNSLGLSVPPKYKKLVS